ncbi:hypothetical protein BC829DRAFT_130164 [Chytridium lagenaria]|nr:hypothetical protein BC829DRAFT_130164 [Chytridium lagenaria]
MLAATIHPSSAATLPRLCSPPASPCSTQELQNQLHRDNLLPSNSYTSLTPSLDTWSSPIFLKDPSFLPSADTTPILNHWDLFDMDPFMNLAFNSNNMSQNVAANSTVSSYPRRTSNNFRFKMDLMIRWSLSPTLITIVICTAVTEPTILYPLQPRHEHQQQYSHPPPIDVIFSNHYQTQPHAP